MQAPESLDAAANNSAELDLDSDLHLRRVVKQAIEHRLRALTRHEKIPFNRQSRNENIARGRRNSLRGERLLHDLNRDVTLKLPAVKRGL